MFTYTLPLWRIWRLVLIIYGTKIIKLILYEHNSPCSFCILETTGQRTQNTSKYKCGVIQLSLIIIINTSAKRLSQLVLSCERLKKG